MFNHECPFRFRFRRVNLKWIWSHAWESQDYWWISTQDIKTVEKLPEPQGFLGAHIIKQEDDALIDEERLAHDNKRLHTIPHSS